MFTIVQISVEHYGKRMRYTSGYLPQIICFLQRREGLETSVLIRQHPNCCHFVPMATRSLLKRELSQLLLVSKMLT